jgi:hypothetical protein
MNIYQEKCPFCGSYIAIKDATICPGCNKSIYYGPYKSWGWGSWVWHWGAYYPDKFQRDQAIKEQDEQYAAEKAFNESPEGIEYAKKQEEEKCSREKQIKLKHNQRDMGIVLVCGIPFVWFFGGHNWEHFGLIGWPALALGLFLIALSSRQD